MAVTTVGCFKADGVDEDLVLHFAIPVTPLTEGLALHHCRRVYAEQAEEIVEAIYRCAPGGLVDAIFGELAHRKASVYRVPHTDAKGQTSRG